MFVEKIMKNYESKSFEQEHKKIGFNVEYQIKVELSLLSLRPRCKNSHVVRNCES